MWGGGLLGSGRLRLGVGGEEDRGGEADQGEGGEADHREDVGQVLVAVGEVCDEDRAGDRGAER